MKYAITLLLVSLLLLGACAETTQEEPEIRVKKVDKKADSEHLKADSAKEEELAEDAEEYLQEPAKEEYVMPDAEDETAEEKDEEKEEAEVEESETDDSIPEVTGNVVANVQASQFKQAGIEFKIVDVKYNKYELREVTYKLTNNEEDFEGDIEVHVESEDSSTFLRSRRFNTPLVQTGDFKEVTKALGVDLVRYGEDQEVLFKLYEPTLTSREGDLLAEVAYEVTFD